MRKVDATFAQHADLVAEVHQVRPGERLDLAHQLEAVAHGRSLRNTVHSLPSLRLFVAVWPPPEIVEQVAAVARPDVKGVRWTPPHHWHVTLRFLGSVEDADPVAAALASVREPSVVATVGPAVGRFGHRILHVPVEGLGPLAAAVVAATGHLGEPPEDRAFTGHLTVARVDRRARVDLRPLAGAPIAGTWTVEEVIVVESRGGRYDVLARFPLSG